MVKGKRILTTFAGRRDRMSLLVRYAKDAISRDLIDEWHVWDFSRNIDDKNWLRSQFPNVRLTPNQVFEYFDARSDLVANGDFVFDVLAASDVHIGLQNALNGLSYELVLGGWHNQKSVLRVFNNANDLVDFSNRSIHPMENFTLETPDLLSFGELNKIRISHCNDFFEIFVYNSATTLKFPIKFCSDHFHVKYRSSFGPNVEWRIPSHVNEKIFLFVAGAKEIDAEPIFNQFYRHYTRNKLVYKDDVFLKCDDDIVYIDLNSLEKFIEFRLKNQNYFLISANVVNNGVCAHLQQEAGLIPAEIGVFEQPERGFCGTLWESGHLAEKLHRFFLLNYSKFASNIYNDSGIVWNYRMSINFVSFLGVDLSHISDFMKDDESYLCYESRWRSKKTNYIYFGLTVAHLSFYSQDPEMSLKDIIRGYDELCKRISI